MLPDIAELEYVRKEETRPRVGDTNPPRPGGFTSEPEAVVISQFGQDEDTDMSFLDAVNQDYTEVHNDSIDDENFNPQAQIILNKVTLKETEDGGRRNKRKSRKSASKKSKLKKRSKLTEDVLRCEMCGQLFPETEEFNRHVETDHSIQCQEDGCGLSFIHEYYLHLHEADVHPTGPPSPPNNFFGQAERWIRSGRNFQLNKFKQYKVSIISFSCFSSPIAVERMKDVMRGRTNSLRHRLFKKKRERESCSGNATSRLWQLSNPGYLGGGGEKDTSIIKKLIENVFKKYINEADPRLKELAHENNDSAFIYTSSVLFPETFIHQLEVKINN